MFKDQKNKENVDNIKKTLYDEYLDRDYYETLVDK